MADDAPDKEQKTLDPTAKRYEDAYKKGQIPISRDLNNLFFIAAILCVFLWVLPWSLSQVMKTLTLFFSMSEDINIDTPNQLSSIFNGIFFRLVAALGPPFILLMLAAIAIGLGQSYKAISTKSLMPKFSNISIVAGAKRIFSKNSLVETAKSAIKLFFLGMLFYFLFKKKIYEITVWLWVSPYEFLGILHQLIVKYLGVVLVAYAFVSGFDFWYQRHRFKENLKMTTQEQKDEYKELEGDPKVRSRIREMQRERSRNRMLGKIADATVIVTNPTHFSVALQWQEDGMDAPIVIAKGADILALKIRELAKEHAIPIVENAPVARSLYDSVNIDQQIPPEYYKVVAGQVLK
jgi:flagellar biosynthesis protein FlhB